MGTLSREEILSRIAEMPREPLEVPELGGEIHIRVMTLKEVKEINKLRAASGDNNIAVYPRVVLLGTCNADGTPLFLPQDLAIFEGGMWPVLDTIVKEIFYLNKIATRPKDEGSTEEAEEEVPKAETSTNGSR
jgi:hypothetical protein